MRIKEGQIFNLMDTNGRRNDVINALQGYLTILDDIQNEQKMNWASMPESLAQYEFYRQAIELSPEIFGKHGHMINLLKHWKEIKISQQPFKLKIWNGFKRIVLCFKVLLSNLI